MRSERRVGWRMYVRSICFADAALAAVLAYACSGCIVVSSCRHADWARKTYDQSTREHPTISELTYLGRKPRPDDGSPVMGDKHHLRALLQILLSYSQKEFGHGLQGIVRIVLADHLTSPVAGKIDSDEDLGVKR